MSDPREQGFNYASGWGSAPKPPLYHHASKLARQLGQEAIQKSAQAWQLDLALWKVRIATTGADKAQAMAALAIALEKALAGPESVTR